MLTIIYKMKKDLPTNNLILPSWIINSFFLIGIISATSMRTLIVFNHLNPSVVRIVWYAGILGYFVFFGFRYYIARKRKRVIVLNDLIGKIDREEELSSENREFLKYILLSIHKSKELINYSYIFITSFIAIIIDIVLSIFNK